MENEVKIVILGAGQGKRMMSDLPKVLMPVHGVPMIVSLLKSVEKSGVDNSPVIVVGYRKELVEETLGTKYHYIVQESLLGTGHAVTLTRDYLEGKAEHIFVLYGDQPFTSAETIKKITEKHLESGKKITMATVKLPDFKDWRINFVGFSRIVRDESGKIVKDVQYKDASNEEIKITEVNPCYFCFEAKWLWENLGLLDSNNAQKEYYLTDLIKIATSEKMDIESIDIDPFEALGANTKAELEILEKFAPN